MNENPYRSPNAVEAESTQNGAVLRQRVATCVFGYMCGGCLALVCGPLVVIALLNSNAIYVLRSVDQIPFIGRFLVFATLLAPACVFGVKTGIWYFRVDEQHRKTWSTRLGVCVAAAFGINLLLEWLFGR